MKPNRQRHLLRYTETAFKSRVLVIGFDDPKPRLDIPSNGNPVRQVSPANELAKQQEKATKGLALSSNLKALQLEDGAATIWFDESNVNGIRVATRIRKKADEQPDDAPTNAPISEYRIEVGVTLSPEQVAEGNSVGYRPFGDEDDPNFIVLDWASIGFYNSDDGVKDPAVLVATVGVDGGTRLIKTEYNMVVRPEVDYTVEQALLLQTPLVSEVGL